MRSLFDRLALALAPAPDSDRLIAAAPTVPLRTAFRRFWPLARPLRGVLAIGLVFAALLPAIEEGAHETYEGPGRTARALARS